MNESVISSAYSTEWAERPVAGVGLGLRNAHINEILQTKPDVAWFEVLADNHTALGGIVPAQLRSIRQEYPLNFHCVGMSLAGTDPLDMVYLQNIKRLAEEVEPEWISDHLCFTQYGEHNFHDLLPVPYTQESLKNISERVDKVQEFLGRKILVENVSSYLEFEQSDLSEAEFIDELLKITDCGLLLDLNNVYVSAQNHNFDAKAYVDRLPLERVEEIHLAGYEDRGDFLLDAHNNKVSDPVWDLYRHVIMQKPNIATLIEWDNNLPALSVLMAEAQLAEDIIRQGNQQGAA